MQELQKLMYWRLRNGVNRRFFAISPFKIIFWRSLHGGCMALHGGYLALHADSLSLQDDCMALQGDCLSLHAADSSYQGIF